MTLLAERPATTEPAPDTAAGTTVVGPALRGGSYVTLPRGSASAGVEGTYVTAPGSRRMPPVTDGSYVTVAGAPAVAAGLVEGSYVTLPRAA
ncbi:MULTISPECIES: hypothetical protein [unclassified Arthrobacter]|uniref:hypothetical protein n=1 Tax=unclassified Arthrobacter TaxID=235627 RepID=UPI001F3027E8|nr:hypothetical protein [Arthrobacter sp. FW305-BF8]UKA56243.1 hypothetical protein LFT45_10230 [Arthrobacter sp. FW305-BF8]